MRRLPYTLPIQARVCETFRTLSLPSYHFFHVSSQTCFIACCYILGAIRLASYGPQNITTRNDLDVIYANIIKQKKACVYIFPVTTNNYGSARNIVLKLLNCYIPLLLRARKCNNAIKGFGLLWRAMDWTAFI